MANTYTQLYFHVIFAVRHRANLMSEKWRDELFKYITGIITNKNQKLMVINGMPDHVHMLIGSRPDFNLSDILRDIKANSSRFINEKGWVRGRFEWQKGFGAFTVGYSQVDMVANYIRAQQEHHRKKSFREEYLEFLRDHAIDFDDQYIIEEL